MKRRNRMIEEADVIICSDADWRHLSEKQPGAKFVLLQSHVTATLTACGPTRDVAECVHPCSALPVCRLSTLEAPQHSCLASSHMTEHHFRSACLP